MKVTKEFKIWDNKAKKVIKVSARKVGKEWMTICPFHDDHNPSFSINEELGVWNCLATDCDRSGVLYRKREIVDTYDHYDENNNFVYQIVRFEPKAFLYRVKDENGKWKWGAKGIKKILYKLPELIKADKNEPVLFVEGGKDVHNVNKLGFVSTTYFIIKGVWPEEFNKYFTDRIVILIPDNDDAGRQFSYNIGKSIIRFAKKVKWLELPGLEPKEDISDWIERGGTREQLLELIEKAPNFENIEIKIEEGIDSKDKFNPRYYSLEILKKYHFFCDKYKRLWIYDEKKGIWDKNGDIILESILSKQIKNTKHIKNNCIKEIVGDVERLSFENREIAEPPVYLIPFNNKIYDLKNDKLIDYSPNHFFINKLPIDFDPNIKECTTIDKIFEDFVGIEKKKLLYEILGYCLYRDYPSHKYFIIFGLGRNGKTTYINILEKVIGKENISAVSIADFQNNYRFASSQLFGKMLNVSGEIDEDIISKTGILKQLTGDDLINCEEKFKKPFTFKNYAKMVNLTNKIPQTLDITTAFFRRMFIIEFEKEFIPGKGEIKKIIDKIPEVEFQALAYKAIEALKRLTENKFVFTNEDEIESVAKKYISISNPLPEFLKKFTNDDINKKIPVKEFKEVYLKYLRAKKIPLSTSQKINKAMELEGYSQVTVTGKNNFDDVIQFKAWSGIGWKKNVESPYQSD